MKNKDSQEKPQVSSAAQKELDKAEAQLSQFNEEVKKMTLDRMNEAPRQESEMQTKMSQSDIQKSKDIYLKPKRSVSCKEKFNEAHREDYNYAKEYVQFIAENKEIIGETLDMWTRPFPGMPAEEWEVPVNKPVWGPRYLAEQIKKCSYHRLIMNDRPVTADGMGTYFGTMIADSVVQRLDAHPVNQRKSVFMGASGF